MSNLKTQEKPKGNILIIMGLLLMVAALILIGYNRYTDNRAMARSDALLDQVKTAIDEGVDGYNTNLEESPDYERIKNLQLPVGVIDGMVCVGIIKIPTQGLELPVIAEFSMEDLDTAPCLYYGSPYTKNLVLCAHNFDSHFLRIRYLEQGDPVTFVDMDGNEFNYTVGMIEVLDPYAVDEMTAGEWDLSMFTCTFDSGSRVTVRCMEGDGSNIIVTD